MHLLHGGEHSPVVTCSSLDGSGIDQIWRIIVERTHEVERSGALKAQRSAQTVKWMWSLVDEQIRDSLKQTDAIRRVAEDAERQVRVGALSAVLGAQAIVRALRCSGTSGRGAKEPASDADGRVDDRGSA
jgi:LAO/AO transport system kinase